MPSNAYGFDFLANQHRSTENEENGDRHELTQQPIYVDVDEPDAPIVDASYKSDLEKQFDIIAFLKEHRETAISPSLILRATGIDLERRDIAVANMLKANSKIRTEEIPNPENPSLLMVHYAYRAEYPSVRDKNTLLAQINRMPTGVRNRAIEDSYAGIQQDIDALIKAGEVIASNNTEDKDRVLFPRGGHFLVELDGIIAVPQGSAPPIVSVSTDVDPRRQIRRGEAIRVGGEWFRVSSAVKEGVSLKEQPTRAQAPLSVVSIKDLSDKNKNEYIRPFTTDAMPLDGDLSNAAAARLQAQDGGPKGSSGSNAQVSNQSKKSNNKRKNNNADASRYTHAVRHGCTKDVRDMYLKTKAEIPESDYELQQKLLEHKLLEPGERMRQKPMKKESNVDPSGKTKKRRYYVFKSQRTTNTHLDGTEIGALLKVAQEQQQMGKSVGDGGM